MKHITLQDGEKVVVDDRDYERVSKYTWSKAYTGNTRLIVTNIDDRHVTLPTFIKEGYVQVTKNNDFTRGNLKEASKDKYTRPHNKSSSQYKGVHWNKRLKRWTTTIFVDGKKKYIGSFQKEVDAAMAYNDAVDLYWGGEGYKNVVGVDGRVEGNEYLRDKDKPKRRLGKSKCRGVYGEQGKYKSYLTYRGKQITLGRFDTKEEAALAYNKAAMHLYGDDAVINNVGMTDELIEFIKGYEIPERVVNMTKAS